MRTTLQKTLASAGGAAVSIICFYTVNGWVIVIPWGAAALLTGYLSNTRKVALVNGAFLGYFLFATYIIIGYNGKTSGASLAGFAAFTIFFSLIGAAAGLAGAFFGWLFKKAR